MFFTKDIGLLLEIIVMNVQENITFMKKKLNYQDTADIQSEVVLEILLIQATYMKTMKANMKINATHVKNNTVALMMSIYKKVTKFLNTASLLKN